jgi:Ras-related protein Rab-4B
MYMSYDFLFKILIIGPEYSGKSSFTSKICNNHFSQYYEPTIGVEYSSTIINIFNRLRIKCQFWDTAGKKIYIPIVEKYYKGVAGIFIVVDISEPDCVEKINFWVKHYLKYKDGSPVVMIIGNKSDKNNIYLNKEEGEAIAKKHEFLYTEVCSKNDINVFESMQLMTKTIFENYNPSINCPGIRLPPSIDFTKKENLERESCCCIF